MQKYRASGHVSLIGLLSLVLVTAVGGVIVGIVVAVVAHFFYAVLLFPLMMGLVGGALIVAVIKRGGVHSPWLAGLFGILIGLVIYGTYRYGEYFDQQRQFIDSLKAEYGDVTETGAAHAMDQFLLGETGSSGFLGFVLYDAKQGVTISKLYSTPGSEMTLSGTLAWIYWGIELLAIIAIAALAARREASQPYCESCQSWYGKERRIGIIEKIHLKDISAALKNGDFAQVRAALLPQGLPLPRLELISRRCEHCATANPVVILRQVTKRGRNNTTVKQLMSGTVTPAQFAEMTGQPLGTVPQTNT